jgi:hypothetical protein
MAKHRRGHQPEAALVALRMHLPVAALAFASRSLIQVVSIKDKTKGLDPHCKRDGGI